MYHLLRGFLFLANSREAMLRVPTVLENLLFRTTRSFGN